MINQTPTLTTFFRLLAITTEPLFLLALALIISILLYIKKQKPQAILFAITSIVTSLTVTLLKNIFKVPRPTSALVLETGYSFPSGHTTFAIVFFGLITYLFTKKQNRTPAIITSIFLVLIIILSRLYLQVHWITDIIGGIVVGGIILTLSIIIYKKS